MSTSVPTAAAVGLDVVPVSVEVDISNGLPGLTIVGLPDKSVDESRERVRSALRASGATVPTQRITLNLAPADLRKEGPSFDLPIAVGILIASGQIPVLPARTLFLGELSLGGAVRPVRGVLPIAFAAAKRGCTSLYVPRENAAEAALVPGLTVLPVECLEDLMLHFKDERRFVAFRGQPEGAVVPEPEVDFADIRGQADAKRALEIAAAGGHNVLLTGPPGTGKTLLAKAMAGILPRLTYEEMLEVTTIYSVAGLLDTSQPLMAKRPFRNPHNSVSLAGLIGGGSWPRPGELSLAHRGVLFLDEIPQFPRHVLEALRGPLEDRYVRISRAQHSLQFPSDCMLVASQNPCPCGNASDPVNSCVCSPVSVERYQQRLSGPIRDRFDITIEVPRITYETLAGAKSENSSDIAQRVGEARRIQLERCGSVNANLTLSQVDAECRVSREAENLLAMAVDRWNISARAYHRVLKVARTIADISGEPVISETVLAEALRYRQVGPAILAKP